MYQESVEDTKTEVFTMIHFVSIISVQVSRKYSRQLIRTEVSSCFELRISMESTEADDAEP